MPKKIGRGGETPFPISTKPNIFTPLRNEELLERRGESAYWFRLTQCPCPQETRVPDCKFCSEGLMKSFQEDLQIEEEISWKVEGRRIYLRYGPIKSVSKIFYYFREQKLELTVQEVKDDYVLVLEELEYYHQVQVDYKVKLISEIETIVNADSKVVFPEIEKNGIYEAVEAIEVKNKNAVPIAAWTLTSVSFEKEIFGEVKIKLKVFQPIKIAYKTFSVDDRNTGIGRSLVENPDGELLAVMGSGYKLGEGDIIILTKSTLRHSMYVKFSPTDFDRLPFSPVAEIDKVISRGKDGFIEHRLGTDFLLMGENLVKWINPKPRSGYSIIYDYYPTFRVTSMVETGMGEDRAKPRQFKMKSVPSMQAR